jgi:hypothetical protein
MVVMLYPFHECSRQTELLSGLAAAVRVQRLWTGAEATTQIPMNIYKAMPEDEGQAGGRNERTVALVGKLGYFPPPV